MTVSADSNLSVLSWESEVCIYWHQEPLETQQVTQLASGITALPVPLLTLSMCCGNRISEGAMAILCGRCGMQLNDGARLCGRCGSAVGAELVQPPPGQYGAQPPTGAYGPQQPPPGQYGAQQPPLGQYGPPGAFGPQQPPPGPYGAQPPPGQYGPQQPPPQPPPGNRGFVPPPYTQSFPGYGQFGQQQVPRKSPSRLPIVIITAVAIIATLVFVGSLFQGGTGTTGGETTPTPVEDVVIPERGEFTDYPIVVGEGTEFPLKGLISIPNNAEGKVPAVVLVHGDGVFSMDEGYKDNKAFRDIGNYLASYGIAVIRYDKRNYEYWRKSKDMFGGSQTAWESQIEDAILATELIKSDPRIDENKVFMLGHSKGGLLAPRIHAEGGNFAGIISLAGTPRSMLEFFYNNEMLKAMALPEGKERDDAIAAVQTKISKLKIAIISMSEDKAKETIWGTEFSYYYYQELEKHPATEYIKNMHIPFLILQGDKDVAVSHLIDYPAWQEALRGRDNVTFRLYEGLNHFMMPSPGYGSDDVDLEYGTPNHVDGQALADIVEWVWSVV